MTEKVTVLRYEHKHGAETRVFRSPESAERARQELAAEWWSTELPQRIPPRDPKQLADEYFTFAAEALGEFCTVETVEVEP